MLGDSVSGTGVLNVDSSSTLTAVQGSISPFISTRLTTLNNAGTLDMTANSSSATDTLTVHGNYVGNNGQLRVQSVVGGDSSASDKLVVDRGTLTGTTQIEVSNLGGVGGVTLQNGIQVVSATNGATSDNSAFSLKSSVSAGPFEYYLFKGGITAGSENSVPALGSRRPARGDSGYTTGNAGTTSGRTTAVTAASHTRAAALDTATGNTTHNATRRATERTDNAYLTHDTDDTRRNRDTGGNPTRRGHWHAPSACRHSGCCADSTLPAGGAQLRSRPPPPPPC